MSKFKDGELCKIVYRMYQHLAGDADIEYTYPCPACGHDVWEVKKRLHTRKAEKGRAIKFKCANCGQWFIVHEDYVNKVGVVTEQANED